MSVPDSPENKCPGDFIGDDLSGVHTCHADCPCHSGQPSSIPDNGGQVEEVARIIDGPGLAVDRADRIIEFLESRPSSPALSNTESWECQDCWGTGESNHADRDGCVKCQGTGEATTPSAPSAAPTNPGVNQTEGEGELRARIEELIEVVKGIDETVGSFGYSLGLLNVEGSAGDLEDLEMVLDEAEKLADRARSLLVPKEEA